MLDVDTKRVLQCHVGGRNVRFDAVNQCIPLVSEEPTIIFGADVTHPTAGEDSGPSIAAVCLFIMLYIQLLSCV